jgi:hypothetical protein
VLLVGESPSEDSSPSQSGRVVCFRCAFAFFVGVDG